MSTRWISYKSYYESFNRRRLSFLILLTLALTQRRQQGHYIYHDLFVRAAKRKRSPHDESRERNAARECNMGRMEQTN